MGAGCRILLIDDDGDVSDVLRMILEDDGHGVVCVGNGHDALRCLQEGPDPDVILLDLRMPALDGWAFQRARLNANLAPAARLVIISSELPALSADLAPAMVLRKPLDATILSLAARRLCGHRHDLGD